jgi:predicted nucleotidyltransferase
MPTLLQSAATLRLRERERLRLAVRAGLRAALGDLLPKTPVTVFGSLVKPGRFNEYSDVDLALAAEPTVMSVFQLSSLLGERLGRRVDVVLLSECRFRARILREGETWMPSD